MGAIKGYMPPLKEAIITANNHAGYYPGAQPITLKLVYCATTGKVLGAQAIGVLTLERDATPFSDDDLVWLEAFAALVAPIIEQRLAADAATLACRSTCTSCS